MNASRTSCFSIELARIRISNALTSAQYCFKLRSAAKYHIVISSDGLPLGAVASAANVHDTRMFPELLRLALVVGARIARLLADAGYDSADNRWLCLRQGIQP